MELAANHSKTVSQSGIIQAFVKDIPIAPPYLAELCRPVVHLTGRRHLRSAASGKPDVQRTATAIGRRNSAVSGPETRNSLQTV